MKIFFKGGTGLWNTLAALGVLAAFLVFVTPAGVFSHGEQKHEHDLENLPDKPEGMIQFEGEGKDTPTPGSEYMEPAPKDDMKMDHGGHDMGMDHGGHDMGHDMGHGGHDMGHDMHGGEQKDPFLTRGEHDLSNIQQPQTKSQALLARGRNIYLHMCVFCHGKDGNGGGEAVDYLYPWPRDFRKGIFKFRSTPTGTLPRDEDLYRTIIKGVPNTSMPAWEAALSPQDTWALVNMIKSFSDRFRKEPPGPQIEIPKPPEPTAGMIARGKELFDEHKCDDCHGMSLKGDGKLAGSLKDAWKHAVFVHDISNPNYLKSGRQPEDLFRTLSTGLDGTPMNSYAHLPEKDRWALVHFIRSKFTKEFEKGEFETDVYSFYVPYELDTDPESPVWEQAKTTNIVLRPLSARRDAVEVIRFQSVNNGKQLAIRLRWKDTTKDGFVENRGDVFRDGGAVQLALGDVTLHTHGHNEPFFGMGNRGKPVNIWHWKAGLEETLEATEDSEYSTGGVDMDALIFGGTMTNPVVKLGTTQQNTVEELNGEGFGTLTPQPKDQQNVLGYGVWEDGEWNVVFLRDMDTAGKWDANLNKEEPILVAFAVWDGKKEDRNGRKVVSVWQRLNVLKENATQQGG
ncbi:MULTISPECIES: ethylbenzene dehydrogenase-related protein [unclassified Nitrospina]|uniref:ethylbenzene dehydrogenase-related protein n=1 Tax=unclassified Nitrospina TaxID=2638683 RepID=UPI003F9756B8